MEHLDGSLQAYAWGDRELIAELQGRPASGEPEAELWLGAHPVAPSTIAGSDRSLADEVAADPGDLLGPSVEARFGQLPFLLKVLAAAQPLSIQAHPSRLQAEQGYAREDAAGVAWDSPTRTYRDANHKPELICALTRFEAKCGFRPLGATRQLFGALAQAPAGGPHLVELAALLATGADAAGTIRVALRWLFDLPAERSAALVSETVAAAADLLTGGDRAAGNGGRGGDGGDSGDSGDSGEDAADGAPAAARFGAELAWTAELERSYPGDVGVVVALLLNHVVLEPGQAMFLSAGNLHSYLRGGGVELMANSDNVVRGGLTPKHVDVEELLAIVDTSPGPPPVQTPRGACHRFASPVPDFSLTRLSGAVDQRFEPAGAEIILVTEGSATIEVERDGARLDLARGRSAFVAWSDGPYRIVAPAGRPVTAWRAAAGDPDASGH